jgi:hypothetical protein
MELVVVEDPETGEQLWLDTASKAVRQQYAAQFSKIHHDVKKVFKTAGADLLQIATGQDYVKILQQFFIQRA